MAPDPTPFALFGYGTAALTYGIYNTFRFPEGKNEEEKRKIKRALIANGFAFGGIAQFVGGLLMFALHSGKVALAGATTAAVFGVLWTAIWLNEYFDADPRPLAFLDIAIAVYTLFAGIWFTHLGLKVVAALLWSIMILVIILTKHHATGEWRTAAGIMALENCLLAYYCAIAMVSNAVIGLSLPL